MELVLGEKYICNVVEICGIKREFPASIQLNNNYQTELILYETPVTDLHTIEETTDSYAHVKIESDFISLFDLLVSKTQFNMIDNEFSKGSAIIIATFAIVGNKTFLPDYTFSQFRFQITDGFELIGLCPYDINENYFDLMLFGDIQIPTKIKTMSANTAMGDFTFSSIPTSNFDKSGMSFGFDHWIDFNSTKPINLFAIREVLQGITDFFSILSGEAVTVNSLRIIEKENSNFQLYDIYGICNYPKFRLNIFDGNGIDSSGYLRKNLFKLSDITDLNFSLNKWFCRHNNLTMAMGAYLRILLDEELKIVTVNKFLACMQLVEGYISTDETQEIKSFAEQKKAFLAMLSDSGDNGNKEFVEKYSSYVGQSFRKKLKEYIYNSLNILAPLSKTQFDKKYKEFISTIIKERDIYIHSSSRESPQIEFNRLMRISSLIKMFYRVLILAEIGMPLEIIRKRFSLERSFNSYLSNIFEIEIEIESSLVTGKFDEQMWNFSNIS